eukprot:g72953.t1
MEELQKKVAEADRLIAALAQRVQTLEASAQAAGLEVHSHESAEAKSASNYEEGHYHYRGCKNDTEASFQKDDCDCATKAKSHLSSLHALSQQSIKK